MDRPRPITVSQMRQLDRIAIEEVGIPGAVLMENAGRAVADEAADLAGEGGSVLVLAGAGNNGGDGYVAARHLDNRGFDVAVGLLAPREKISGEAGVNLGILEKMGVATSDIEGVDRIESMLADVPAGGVVVDAMLGTGLSGEVREPFASAIRLVNRHSADTGAVVVAVDVPSGLDADTGRPLGKDAIRAQRTVTFQYLKAGFVTAQAREYVGELVVADITIPVGLIERVL